MSTSALGSIHCTVGDGRIRADDAAVGLAAADFRERFSRQRRRRRSSTDSSPAVGVSSAADAVDGPSAESIAGVFEEETGGAAALELIQTASPLRDH